MAERNQVCAIPRQVNLGGIMDAGGVVHDHVDTTMISFINCLTYERTLWLELAIAPGVIPTSISVLSASGKFMLIPTDIGISQCLSKHYLPLSLP
jgi:hypothetical protein